MTTRKPKEETSLATTESKTGNYLALQGDSGKVAEIIRENLQGQQLSAFDLDRVVVPTGGGTTFEIPTLEGSEPSKTIQGIIVHFTAPRAYWEHGLDESSEAGPPDCSSPDGKVGRGKFNGKLCETCPMNQFNSGRGGRGKACKEKRMIFMLQPESYIPLVIQVPTMSIGPLKQYMMRLASRGRGYWSVETELSLEAAQQSGGGLKYSRIVPKVAQDGLLSDEEAAHIKEVADGLKAVLAQNSFNQVAPDAEDRYLNDLDDHEGGHEPYYDEDAEQQQEIPF